MQQQIEAYLADETKLYQDWYVGLTQTEDNKYTKKVGVIPPLDELKKMCEN